MKKAPILILVMVVLLIFNADSFAFWWQEKKEESESPKAAPAKTRQISGDAKQILKETKRKQLNNTEWEIELTTFGDPKRKRTETDILTFQNNQVSSASLSKQGYSPTNYTPNLQDDETFVWETMQTAAKGGVAFWRGEIDANMEKMQGILSHHVSDKKTNDYTFQSVNKRVIPSSAQE